MLRMLTIDADRMGVYKSGSVEIGVIYKTGANKGMFKPSGQIITSAELREIASKCEELARR